MFGAAGMALLGMATRLPRRVHRDRGDEPRDLRARRLPPPRQAPRRRRRSSTSCSAPSRRRSCSTARRSCTARPARRSSPSCRRGGGSPLYLAGLGLVAAGIAFKVAAVPFHAWTPDVYEGAPTPVTAFMAAGVKTAAFAFLARIFLSAEVGGAAQASAFSAGSLSGLAVLTMIFGNLLAVPQRSVKRMLAYSSVAHAGYLLVGVVSASVAGAREKALAGHSLLPRRLRRDGDRRVRDRRRARASRAPRRRAGRRVGPRAVRRPRPPPSGARVRDGGLPALARGHPAHRRLRREALHLPGGRRSAALRPRDRWAS